VRATLDRLGARATMETARGFSFRGRLLDRRWGGSVLTCVWRGEVDVAPGASFTIVRYRLWFWGNHLVRLGVVALGAAIAMVPATDRNRVRLAALALVAWVVFAAIDYFIAKRWFPEELGAELSKK
jgi:hypothetical protein